MKSLTKNVEKRYQKHSFIILQRKAHPIQLSTAGKVNNRYLITSSDI